MEAWNAMNTPERLRYATQRVVGAAATQKYLSDGPIGSSETAAQFYDAHLKLLDATENPAETLECILRELELLVDQSHQYAEKVEKPRARWEAVWRAIGKIGLRQ